MSAAAMSCTPITPHDQCDDPEHRDRSTDRDQQHARQHAHQRGDQRDDPDARVGDHVLAPRLLEQLSGTLHGLDGSELFDHEHREHEERHERPGETDQRADDPADDPGSLLHRAQHDGDGGAQHRPRQQHVGTSTGRVHRLADRHRFAAETLVGCEHERGVEEHEHVGDGEVADGAQDPGQGLGRSARSVVDDQRHRAEERERDHERRQAREQREHGELAVFAQHAPRRLREIDRVLQPSTHGSSSGLTSGREDTAARAPHSTRAGRRVPTLPACQVDRRSRWFGLPAG